MTLTLIQSLRIRVDGLGFDHLASNVLIFQGLGFRDRVDDNKYSMTLYVPYYHNF